MFPWPLRTYSRDPGTCMNGSSNCGMEVMSAREMTRFRPHRGDYDRRDENQTYYDVTHGCRTRQVLVPFQSERRNSPRRNRQPATENSWGTSPWGFSLGGGRGIESAGTTLRVAGRLESLTPCIERNSALTGFAWREQATHSAWIAIFANDVKGYLSGSAPPE